MKKNTLIAFFILIFQQNYGQYTLTELPYLANSLSGEPQNFFVYDNKLHFAANNTTQLCNGINQGNIELWNTTGELGTIQQVADINSCGGSYPSNFFEFNGAMYFTAGIGEFGTDVELYKTQGNTTTIFKEFNVGSGASFDLSSKIQFRILNNKMYFFASEGGVNNYDLWRTDGTLSGTEKVADLNTIDPSILPNAFLTYNNELYFVAAEDNLGRELYKYNEQTNLVTLVKDIYPGSNSSSPRELIVFNNELFFHATDPISFRRELYKTDGTSVGTISYRNFTSGIYGPTTFKVLNNQLLFVALNDSSGQDLYKCTYNSSNFQYEISLIKDFNKGTLPFNFVYGATEFIEFNNQLYFSAREIDDPSNGTNMQIYKTDGTTTGTTIAVSFNQPGFASSKLFSIYGNKLFFFRESEITIQDEIWVTDGTNNFLQRITGNNTNTANRPYAFKLIEYNNELYFTADSSSQDYEIWKITDSTLSSANNQNPKIVSIFPNPTEDFITVQLEIESDFTIEIYDLVGKRVSQYINQKQLDFSNLDSGIYLVKITLTQSNQTTTHKIIKK
jgi:ELWxxDGT repeat protein